MIEVEADLRIDAPFGPLHLRSEDRALVIGVGGWWSALRMALWSWRNRTVPAGPLLAALATATGQPVRLHIPLGPRVTLARP